MYQEIINSKKVTSLEECVSNSGEGLYLEFGVSEGHTIKIISKCTNHKIYGFDSFEGLPEDWEEMHPKGHFACKIPTELPDNVELIVGMFEKTLPNFVKQHKKDNVAFVHIDCDLYSSTKCVFDNLKKLSMNNAIICFDELINYHGWENHEWKAWNEFLEETEYKWELLGVYSRHQAAFKIYK